MTLVEMAEERRDLLGDEVARPRSTAQCKGYAAAPGTGPAGETCGTCHHRYRRSGARRNFHKCSLVRETRGKGTDILYRSPACKRWQQKEASE